MASEKQYGKYRIISKAFVVADAVKMEQDILRFQAMVNNALDSCELVGSPAITSVIVDGGIQYLIVQAVQEVYYD